VSFSIEKRSEAEMYSSPPHGNDAPGVICACPLMTGLALRTAKLSAPASRTRENASLLISFVAAVDPDSKRYTKCSL
jgi:hypothetical protein